MSSGDRLASTLVPTADSLLGPAAVAALPICLERATPERPLPALRGAADGLDGLGFGERVALVRDALLADLPADYDGFARILRAALADSDFTGWMIWPVGEAVAVRALDAGTPEAFDDGLALLAALTPRLTAEAALRPFLDADLERALATVLRWTGDPDEHVRRLASEGTRPRLPWAKRARAVLADPPATIPILDALYRDREEYVRRSVANHLNDVSRAEPELAVAVATRWLAEPDANTVRVVRHAMRTLIKQGDPAALALHGFAAPADLVVSGLTLDAEVVRIGGELGFAFTLENRDAQPVRLAVDYVVHYRKANGRTAPKVFKLTTKTLAPGETLTVTRRQSFRPITTRRHHPGEHAIELQINGRRYGPVGFLLADD